MGVLDRAVLDRGDHWRATPAFVRALALPLLTVPVALLWQRPDLLVLAAPCLLVLAWSVVTRPVDRPARAVRLSHSQVREGEQALVVTDVDAVEHADLVAVALSPTPHVDPVNDRSAAVADADAAARPRLLVGVRPQRWGPRRVGPVQVAATSPWGSFRWGPVTLETAGLRVLPQPAAFDNAAPAPHPRGLVGTHRSARPGDGSEFRSLRPFQVGDRLRRIHWPRSTRTGELYVTASYADEDTHVAILVDAHYDLGRSGGIGKAESSLDRSVRAAAAVAEHFLRQGDRVGLRVLSARTPMTVRPGTGTRHGHRVLDALSRVVPGVTEQVDTRALQRGLREGTLVVMISSLISPHALTEAATLASRGLSVVVVDALVDAAGATPAGADEKDPLARLAWQLRLLERDREIRSIQARGVAVVPWLGPGSLDMVLRQLARRRQGAGRSA